MNKFILIILTSFITLFFVGCSSKPELYLPMPSKVKDYSGYASGYGTTAQFAINNNGMVMKYNDAITGNIVLMRDKDGPLFRGQFRDGITTRTRSNGNAMAFGNVAYGNSSSSTSSSAKIRDIIILYVYGYPSMKIGSSKHSSKEMTNVVINTKQDFSAWHKQIDVLLIAGKTTKKVQ